MGATLGTPTLARSRRLRDSSTVAVPGSSISLSRRKPRCDTRAMAWASDFEAMKRGEGCEMCEQGRPEEDGYGIRFAQGRYSDAYLEKAAVQRGWSVVVWRGRHVAEATELSDEEATEYWREVLAASRAVEMHYRPLKLNLMQLGNALPHLHTHVLPRYSDDAQGGGPFEFPTEDVGLRTGEELRLDVAALRGLVEHR
jgi:diadenosine tetraphosphate (Ap4A) HIT family hydrolase